MERTGTADAEGGALPLRCAEPGSSVGTTGVVASSSTTRWPSTCSRPSSFTSSSSLPTCSITGRLSLHAAAAFAALPAQEHCTFLRGVCIHPCCTTTEDLHIIVFAGAVA